MDGLLEQGTIMLIYHYLFSYLYFPQSNWLQMTNAGKYKNTHISAGLLYNSYKTLTVIFIWSVSLIIWTIVFMCIHNLIFWNI